MAVLTTTAFFSKYNAIFADNTSREVSEADMREFAEDIKDSFSSVIGATTIQSWKDPCQVSTTVNITLSGEQTIDGVLTSGSRVLVKNQSTATENGIYVSAAGAWSRSTDADADAELEGAAVGVTQGTVNQNTVWIQTTDSVSLGSSSIAWQQIGFGAAVGVAGQIQRVTRLISSAELLAINATPITLIAAPGSGKSIQILGATIFYDFITAAYSQNGGLLVARFNGGTINYLNLGTTLELTADTSIVPTINIGAMSTGTGDITNKSLQLLNTVANPTLGSGTLKVIMLYIIQDFN